MRRLILLLILLALAVPLSAGTIKIDFGSPITITTTAAQDLKLTRALADYNAQIAPKPAVGMEQFIKFMIIAGVQQYVDKVNESEQLEACTNLNNLGANARNQILTALGGKSPCR